MTGWALRLRMSHWLFAKFSCRLAIAIGLCGDPCMDDWNEMQLVLAVHRAGSLTGAAKRLGIDHSTVFRRLATTEAQLGVRLFERLPGGSYRATAGGERMAAAAERMEDEALAVQRDIAGRDHRLSGRLRLAASETLANRLLVGHLAAFRKAHPGIVLDLSVDNRVLNLARREADIALRPIRPKESALWGRKLADVAWTLFAAPEYLDAHSGRFSSSAGLDRCALIGWEETARGIKAADWLSRAAPQEAFAYRTNSLVNQAAAARCGIGLALLPCYLGDSDSGLARAFASPIPELTGELWIVTHSDLKRTARIRAFFDVVGERLAQQRSLFDGSGQRPETS
ncbi:LysR family transcriptional regulator [Marinivivus vitaminiproducens]|uniref:LysR family transcriptional regulator n=1 Tax=Marinivivus vitaminiproducens TaxID=3035935 RepID=UPI00279FCAD7|nr:LysR family transcriptional regulator [Geminicoccaceae bacterium SCSIO 64248]